MYKLKMAIFDVNIAVGKSKCLVILYLYKLTQPSDPLILGGSLILKQTSWKISRASFIDLWPCLFTTKLSYAQLFKWGHRLPIASASRLGRQSSKSLKMVILVCDDPLRKVSQTTPCFPCLPSRKQHLVPRGTQWDRLLGFFHQHLQRYISLAMRPSSLYHPQPQQPHPCHRCPCHPLRGQAFLHLPESYSYQTYPKLVEDEPGQSRCQPNDHCFNTDKGMEALVLFCTCQHSAQCEHIMTVAIHQ